jgi:hypothetical protein
VRSPVSLADLHPTLLELAGLETAQSDAVSLLRWGSVGVPRRHPILAVLPVGTERHWSYQRGRLRLIVAGSRVHLFDEVADSRNRRDLAPQMPADVDYLREQLEAELRSSPRE